MLNNTNNTLSNTKVSVPNTFKNHFGMHFKKCNQAINWLSNQYITNHADVNKYLLLAQNVSINNISVYEYYVFYNINNFLQYFQILSPFNRRWYCVYFTQKRSLHLDIDCYELNLQIDWHVLKNQLITLFEKLQHKPTNWQKNIHFFFFHYFFPFFFFFKKIFF